MQQEFDESELLANQQRYEKMLEEMAERALKGEKFWGYSVGPLGRIIVTLLEAPRPKQTLVHLHAGAEELGRVYAADLMLQASVNSAAKALESLSAPPPSRNWPTPPPCSSAPCTPRPNCWPSMSHPRYCPRWPSWPLASKH